MSPRPTGPSGLRCVRTHTLALLSCEGGTVWWHHRLTGCVSGGHWGREPGRHLPLRLSSIACILGPSLWRPGSGGQCAAPIVPRTISNEGRVLSEAIPPPGHSSDWSCGLLAAVRAAAWAASPCSWAASFSQRPLQHLLPCFLCSVRVTVDVRVSLWVLNVPV